MSEVEGPKKPSSVEDAAPARRVVPLRPVQGETKGSPIPLRPVSDHAPAAKPIPLRPVSSEPQENSVPLRPVSSKVVQPVPVARPVPVPATSPTADSKAEGAKPLPVPVAVSVTEAKPAVKVREEEDAATSEDATAVAVKAAPPWLVSAVVHMVILIVLGLWYLAAGGKRQVEIEVVYAEELGEQIEDDLMTAVEMDLPEILDPAFSIDDFAVDDPLASPPELDLSVDGAFTSLSELTTPSIGIALTGREKGAKQALLSAYGGTGTTEAAVQLGLEWLVKQQDPRTGIWSLSGPYADGGREENTLAATAMALLALQGAGNTHREGKHQRAVSRGANALVRMQDESGNFWKEGPYHHPLYSQAQATIAIVELYGMTKDERYRKPAQKALDYAAKIQNPTLGGWRYVPLQETDTSVTGWFVMALQSGKMAGLDVQSPSLDAISKYLDRVTKDGSFYAYRIGEEPTLTMTAEALLCRQYLGWAHDDARLREGVDYILERPIDYDEDENVYYWYYATQLMHHMGGDDWDRWNSVMREAVPERQVKDGRERGSWNPGGDRWGHIGGRLYTTCLSIFNLEVYYRHLPIYKHF